MSTWAEVGLWLVIFGAVYWATSAAFNAWERRWAKRHALDEVIRRDRAQEALRHLHEKD